MASYIRKKRIELQEKSLYFYRKNALTVRAKRNYKFNPTINHHKTWGHAMTRKAIALKLKMSPGHLSDILNCKKPIGKAAACKFSSLTGIDWKALIDMERTKLETLLSNNVDPDNRN